MTPKERAAMQQALEALELGSDRGATVAHKVYAETKAITALREALAEQSEQEPVAIDGLARACNLAGIYYKDFLRIKAYLPIAAPVRQAEQEPVATIGNWGKVEWAEGVFPQLGAKLYAAPVRTKDLTDDEILEITKRFALGIAFPVGGATTPEMFARAVIAADREKNK